MKILENKQLLMECPVCSTRHYVHIFKRESHTVIEGMDVTYPETVYRCKMDDDPKNEVIPEKVVKENAAAAKKVYKEMTAPKAKEEPSAEEIEETRQEDE